MKNLQTDLLKMEKALSRMCAGIRVVLPTRDSKSMILPEEDSAYIHVYLLNVPGAIMLDVEDVAYDFWESVRPEAVSFFLYTPEETARKYPDYSAKQANMLSSELMAYLKSAGEWLSHALYEEPHLEGWELVHQSQQMAGSSGVGYIRADSRNGYSTTASLAVDADPELAQAA